MSDKPVRPITLAAWVVLFAGIVGALATLRALWRVDRSNVDAFWLLIVLVPYVAGGMLLQITGKARLVTIALFVPVLADIFFGCFFTFAATPGWDWQITWRLIRGLLCSFLLLISLGVGLWLEKVARAEESRSSAL